MWTLNCQAIDPSKVREIFGTNMNLMPTDDNTFSVSGVVGFADQTQQQFQAVASGTLAEDTINLTLGDVGDLSLVAQRLEGGDVVYVGEVKLMGDSDLNNLACRLADNQDEDSH